MTTAVLSIGSNLGDRLDHLRGAVAGLGDRVRAVSPVYETAPWGVTDQPAFLNAVVLAGDSAAGPYDWLSLAHRLEAAAERTRERRWGPRTLDVDVVTVDAVRSTDPALTLPHPRAAERAFVLAPWDAVDPAAELDGVAVRALLDALPESERAGVVARDELELR